MDEQTRLRNLLATLNGNEAFQQWRDLVAKPVIDQIDAQLAQPLELTEANLKSLVMYRNLVNSLFYRLFEELAAEKAIEENK
jgi:hypothetical protein